MYTIYFCSDILLVPFPHFAYLMHYIPVKLTEYNILVLANLVYQGIVKDTSTLSLDIKEGTSLQSAALLLKCLKILENATFLSDQNKVIFHILEC